MKKVVGASVMDGKYVYVRGLGDRYSNTQLNGSLIPSPDPEKQAVPMDLIPANLLDNIVVTKTFTPDKPGNFSGGSVDLRTKDFPKERTLSLWGSSAYNSLATTNDDYKTFDASSSNVPTIWDDPATQVAGSGFPGFTFDKGVADAMAGSSQSFSSRYAQENKTGPVDRSFGGSYGDNWQLFDRQLGVNATFSYNEGYRYYENGIDAKYARRAATSDEMTIQHYLHDSKSSRDELYGGLANLSYSLHSNHKVGFTFVYNRSDEYITRYLEGGAPETFSLQGSDTTSARLESWVYEVKERTLESYQFKGDHALLRLTETANPIRLDWRISFSDARQYTPDQRFFTHRVEYLNDDAEPTDEPQDYVVDETDADILPTRYFRDVNEDNSEFGADLTLPLTQRVQFKTGFAAVAKDRRHEQRAFIYYGPRSYSGIPQDYIDAVGYRETELPDGRIRYDFSYYMRERTVGEDQYVGTQDIAAAYGMFDLRLTSKLLLIAGARVERTEMFAENGFDTSRAEYKSGEINVDDVLPAVNLVYSLGENTNVRAAFGRTLARPTIREFAPFASQDFGASGKVYNGNPGLDRTLIDNYDLRWEWFLRPGEVLAVSAFYKKFKNPIELAILDTNEGQVGPVNVPEATLVGIELEARRRLDHVADVLRNFDLGLNLTLVDSRVDIPETELVQLRAFIPDADDTRQMYGQAPYIVNVSLGFSSPGSGTTVTAQYNRAGERFAVNAPGGTPDVYVQPADLFDVIASQNLFGAFKLKAAVKNIFDSNYEERYQKSNDIYRLFSTGRQVSLGLTLNLY
jgi:TonB-dependent receptor